MWNPNVMSAVATYRPIAISHRRFSRGSFQSRRAERTRPTRVRRKSGMIV